MMRSNKLIKKFEEEGIQILNGRYGPYISKDDVNYKIPKTSKPEDLDLESCLIIIKDQDAKGKSKPAARKKNVTKKVAAKSATKTKSPKAKKKES